jgi:hypothetical protein
MYEHFYDMSASCTPLNGGWLPAQVQAAVEPGSLKSPKIYRSRDILAFGSRWRHR